VTEGSRELDALVMIAAGVVPEPEEGIADGWSWRPEPGYSDFHRDHTVCRRAIRPDGTMHSHGFGNVRPPNLTTSIDAALTLIPEGLEELCVETTTYSDGMAEASLCWGPCEPFDRQSTEGVAKTLPLAICIAALKARVSVTL
jgi:hypothetical protein